MRIANGRKIFVVICLAVALSASVSAQDDPLAFPDSGQPIELTLEDAIALALERNLALRIERVGRRQALQGVLEALGIFDFDIGFNTAFNENSRPTSSTLEAADVLTDETLSADITLSQLLDFGGTAGLTFTNRRSESTDRNRVPNPSYSVNLGLSFNQPLLQGFGRTFTRQGVLIAQNQTEISREDFQIQVEDIIRRVSDGYWNLVEARNQLKVAQESLEQVRALHELNILREEAGVLAPLEVTRSEADVAVREEEIIGIQAAVEDQTDIFRGLLNLERGPLWDVEVIPVTPPGIDPVEIDVERAVEEALAHRPEIQRQRLSNKNREINTATARSNVRPRLDLQASWNINALEGDILEFPDEGEPIVIESNDYGDTLSALLEREFEGWRLALNFSYPLQNRTARARLTRSELELDRGDLELRQLEQEIMIDVRNTARAVLTAARQIESARRSSELAEKTLEVEELSYRSGQSSGFEVLESQERLRDARSREASTLTAYRRALTAYQLSLGRLLEEHGIELADDPS